MPTLPRLSALALLLATASACSAPPTQPDAAMPPNPTASPVSGVVTDLPAFEQFIASRPTPAEFQSRYPDVVLVLPGQVATKEFRLNNSRYFAKLDGEGRINGGRFQ